MIKRMAVFLAASVLATSVVSVLVVRMLSEILRARNRLEISVHSDPISNTEIYRRAGLEWEHYDRLIWQTTTLAVTVLGGLLFVAYPDSESPLERLSILVAAGAAGMALRVGLSKHRQFSITRSEILDRMEREAVTANTIDFMIQRSKPRANDEYAKRVEARNWFWRQSAYNWLASVTLLALVVIFVLALVNLVCFIDQQDWFSL